MDIEKIIEKSAKNILNKMGFSCEITIEKNSIDEQKNYICNIETTVDSNFLIGRDGDNLRALQHLVRLVVRKQTDELVKFILDINSYKKEKNISIVELTKSLAEQAVKEKRSITMKPMSAYERRLVHMEATKNDDIHTESIGERGNRRVVIKPI